MLPYSSCHQYGITPKCNIKLRFYSYSSWSCIILWFCVILSQGSYRQLFMAESRKLMSDRKNRSCIRLRFSFFASRKKVIGQCFFFQVEHVRVWSCPDVRNFTKRDGLQNRSSLLSIRRRKRALDFFSRTSEPDHTNHFNAFLSFHYLNSFLM